MPVLHVILPNREQCIPFELGLTAREVLDAADIAVHGTGGGRGICALCLVQIQEGTVSEPSANELLRLSADQIQGRARLACQVRPLENVRISVEEHVPHTMWRHLSEDETSGTLNLARTRPTLGEGESSFGVAVDLGTSEIRVTVWDMLLQRRIAGRAGVNPQIRFGSDVLTRLMVASERTERAGHMGRLVRDAIAEALQDISSEGFQNLPKISRMVIVGNTAMLALLTESNYERLLEPDNWIREIPLPRRGKRSWCESWGLEEDASIEVIQPLAGFVGSDLPAEPGAIYRIDGTGNSPHLVFRVIAGAEPRGLCGSGLVDLIAWLVRTGRLKTIGRLSSDDGDKGVFILQGRRDLVLTSRDVDVFQRAKAAVGAATQWLIRKAGMQVGDLQRVCVCGTLGRFLHVANAQEIGLLPATPLQTVELCGNTALAGCELLLLSPERIDTLEEVKGKITSFNMSQEPEFEELFIENLRLCPLLMDENTGFPARPKGGPP